MNRLNINDIRKDYKKYSLDENSIGKDPIKEFIIWFEEIKKVNKYISNCMVLSTVDRDKFPNARVVLLKEINDDGFVFFTNYDSDKGEEIDMNNQVCLTFFWNELERQVRVRGLAEKLSSKLSEKYFHSRPIDSQIGCLASQQSKDLSSRNILEKRFEELKKQYKDSIIPKPNNWGAYIVKPINIEFWQGRPNRLHDRIIFKLNQKTKQWKIKRIYP